PASANCAESVVVPAGSCHFWDEPVPRTHSRAAARLVIRTETLTHSSRLERLLDRTTRRPLPAADWLREGPLGRILWVTLFGLVFALAGIIRTVTGVALWTGLLVAVPLWTLVIWPFWPALTARRPGSGLHLALGCLAVTLVAAFAVYCLYSRY